MTNQEKYELLDKMNIHTEKANLLTKVIGLISNNEDKQNIYKIAEYHINQARIIQNILKSEQ